MYSNYEKEQLVGTSSINNSLKVYLMLDQRWSYG